MDRREFFRAGGRKAAEVVVRLADERATQRAKQWLRPPYAKPELEFLLSCTRCDACMAACPHEVIHPAGALWCRGGGHPGARSVRPGLPALRRLALRRRLRAKRSGAGRKRAPACDPDHRYPGLPALFGAGMRRLRPCLPGPRRPAMGGWHPTLHQPRPLYRLRPMPRSLHHRTQGHHRRRHGQRAVREDLGAAWSASSGRSNARRWRAPWGLAQAPCRRPSRPP